ncbi:hypothetical protein LWI29_009676 [Acer saccharum]|uniref:Uncharacterized protein n=1 Tax=Acer saccharum TaxID=4024 RepID=A0AA39RVB9_ACESA|nr:hypothetical protein LWI29_009676 [Acer saccharum]
MIHNGDEVAWSRMTKEMRVISFYKQFGGRNRRSSSIRNHSNNLLIRSKHFKQKKKNTTASLSVSLSGLGA